MNGNHKRILIGCSEIPESGGMSAATYKLFEMMQSDGLDVHLANVIDSKDSAFFRFAYGKGYGNPGQLANVHNCAYGKSNSSETLPLAETIRKISPDILLGVGYTAARFIKNAAPAIPLFFLSADCYRAEQLIRQGKAKDASTLIQYLQKAVNVRQRFQDWQVSEVVRNADLIMANSPLSHSLFQSLFSNQVEKFYDEIVWSAEWIYQDARQYTQYRQPFQDRDIDILFMASSWKHPEKNYPLAEKIAGQFKDRSIHLIGECERPLKNVHHHDPISNREEIFRLMGRSKTVVCPSLLDAAPNFLFGAAAMACNIVTSENCGNWQICHKDLLVDPFSLENFCNNIKQSFREKYPDNIDFFLQQASYQDLVETLLVF